MSGSGADADAAAGKQDDSRTLELLLADYQQLRGNADGPVESRQGAKESSWHGCHARFHPTPGEGRHTVSRWKGTEFIMITSPHWTV